MTPAVVGLTLNYRGAQRTTRCIRSLLAGGVSDVLVWDNSEDGGASAEILRAHWQDDARVHLNVSATNLGFAAGANAGFRWIRHRWPGRWVFLINNDATLIPEVLTKLHARLSERTDAILVYPEVCHGGERIGQAWYQRWLGLITSHPLPGAFPYPSGCALLVALERAPLALFDEDFFMYGEDIELGWRYRGSGKLHHLPVLAVWHEGSASSGMASYFYERQTVAAHWLLAHKLARSRLGHLTLLLGRGLSLPVRALLRAWRYRSSEPLRVLWCSFRFMRGSPRVGSTRPQPPRSLDQP